MKIVRKTRDQEGFSLLELLIAISFLAIALLAVAGLQTTAIDANIIANKLSAATSIAQQVMEDLTSRKIDDPIYTSTFTNITYNFNPNPLGTPAFNIAVPGAGTYSATYSTVPAPPTDPLFGTTRVDVIVRGDAATGRRVALTTYVRTN
jgi:prepilin-type N-terminal cleavage/methylation domain-containing protein